MSQSIEERLTAENFITFVEAQDPNKKIEHFTGWCDCAVGEYITSVKGLPATDDDALSFIDRFNLPHNQYHRLYTVLNISGLNMKLPTYGDLQQFINNNFRFEDE